MQNGDRRGDAIKWHIRLSDPAASADSWAAFTNWLESDPANVDAYDAVASADAELSDTLCLAQPKPLPAQNDNEPGAQPWYRRPKYMGIAASVMLAIVVSPAFMRGRDLQVIETRAGEMREIALPDGSRIAMNGATRIALDRQSNRFARLDEGEAVFTIRHDPAHSFELETAGATLRDLGTIFNVRQDNDKLEVSVAQGSVQFNPKAEALTVSAGQKLLVSADLSPPLLVKANPATVAGWRRGQLSYEETRLSAIALDLTRALGTKVSVSEEIANRRFTGLIRIERDRELLFRRLEALLGVRARHSAKGWQLTA